jgi:hypothetical protein
VLRQQIVLLNPLLILRHEQLNRDHLLLRHLHLRLRLHHLLREQQAEEHYLLDTYEPLVPEEYDCPFYYSSIYNSGLGKPLNSDAVTVV